MTFTDLLDMPLPPRLALPNKFWEVTPDYSHPTPHTPVPMMVHPYADTVRVMDTRNVLHPPASLLADNSRHVSAIVAETPIRLRTVRPGNPLSFRSGPVTPAERRSTPRRASQTVVSSRVVPTPGTPSPVDDLSF